MADDDKDAQNASGAPDDAGGTNTGGGGDSGASGAAGGGNGGTDNGDGGAGDDKKPDTVTRDEFDALFRRMQAADKRASDAEQKLKGIEDKDKTELERATGRVQELESDLEAARRLIDELALKNAFFTDNKHTWYDPADALALLDREGVEVKDGNVTGLGPAIEKLAKAKPHLLKKDDGGGSGSNGSSGASGSANNGRRKGDDKDDKRDYSGRFPALRGR